MESRDGLIVGAVTTRASGHAERVAAGADRTACGQPQPVMLGADNGCDVSDFFNGTARQSGDLACGAGSEWAPFGDRSPHHRPSRLCGLPHIRKRIGEASGWAKTVVRLCKMRHRGLSEVDWPFTLAMAAYDLIPLAQRARSARARNL